MNNLQSLNSNIALRYSFLFILSYAITLPVWIQVKDHYHVFLVTFVSDIIVKNYPISNQSIEFYSNDSSFIRYTFEVLTYKNNEKIIEAPIKTNGIHGFLNAITPKSIIAPVNIFIDNMSCMMTKFTPVSLAIFMVYAWHFRKLSVFKTLAEILVILFITHITILFLFVTANINNNVHDVESILNTQYRELYTQSEVFRGNIASYIYQYLRDSIVFLEPFLIGVFLYSKTISAAPNNQKETNSFT